MAVPAAALSVAFEPIQSGTGDPSPTNIRPISGRTEVNLGRTGKNLLPITLAGIKEVNTTGTWSGNKYTINGVTVEVETDNYGYVSGINVSGTSSAAVTFYLFNGDVSMGAGDYIYSAGAPMINGSYALTLSYDTSGQSDIVDASSKTLSITDKLRECHIYIWNGKTVNFTAKPMLRDAIETDPTFAPYKGSVTLTIALGQTVYGGNLDVLTGVLTITHAIIDLGDLTWALISGLAHSFRAVVSGKKNATSASVVDDIICTCYKTVTGTEATTLDDVIGGSTGNSYIYITDSDYDDPTSFKTFVTGQKIVYALDTPTTVQLTGAELEMLKGYNSLSTDGGDVITVTAYAINEEVEA